MHHSSPHPRYVVQKHCKHLIPARKPQPYRSSTNNPAGNPPFTPGPTFRSPIARITAAAISSFNPGYRPESPSFSIVFRNSKYPASITTFVCMFTTVSKCNPCTRCNSLNDCDHLRVSLRIRHPILAHRYRRIPPYTHQLIQPLNRYPPATAPPPHGSTSSAHPAASERPASPVPCSIPPPQP